MGTRLPVFLGFGLLAGCGFTSDDGLTVGSKGLWVANGTNVVEYNPAQLGSGTAATAPHVSINSEVFGSPQGVAFDPMGNLWVVDPKANIKGVATPALYEFSAAQLAALATDNAPEPVVIITSTFMQGPRQIVIDVLGNAWIADPVANAVLTYTAAQLSQTGSQALGPVLVISSDQFANPSGIAFDSAGDLWVSNGGTATAPGTTIVEITKAKIPAIPEMGTSTPKVVSDASLGNSGGTVQGPWALAIDLSDNLWWTNNATSTIDSLPGVSHLVATVVPTTPIGSAQVNSVATINAPTGICIDDVGNIAVVSSAGAFGIAIFNPNQLEKATTAPATFIVGAATTLNEPQGCAFGPTVK
jgi:sugar lactone lactonase YvrE